MKSNELYCQTIEESQAIPLEEKERRAIDRLKWLIQEFRPSNVFAACSGGHDSRTITHLTSRACEEMRVEFKVFHIDTGIKVIDEEYDPENGVRSLCEERGWNLLVYRAKENKLADGSPDPMIYENIVLKGLHGKGFPYAGFPRAAAHSLLFSRIKGRQINRLQRDYADGGKILITTGVRMFESVRRWGTVSNWGAYNLDGNIVWGCAIAEWTGTDVKDYMRKYEIPQSALKAGFCHSGECLCNCYLFDDVQIEFLKQECPKTWAMISEIERKAKEQGYPWGYNDPIPDWWNAELYDKGELLQMEYGEDEWTPPLCTSCVSRHLENEALRSEMK